MQEIRNNEPQYLGWRQRWPSSTTQFVVGGADETDNELLSTTEFGFKSLGLRRVYFSSFRPIPDTPLQDTPPTLPKRELRLYQASYLLRDYGYTMEELPFESDGNLPFHTDPKVLWADKFLRQEPLELNYADYDRLLRIPGVGRKSAQAIIKARIMCRINTIDEIAHIGINVMRMSPYVLLNGKRPPFQQSFLT
jgi:predicted DNA-binding helix-hairpin-helix protein